MSSRSCQFDSTVFLPDEEPTLASFSIFFVRIEKSGLGESDALPPVAAGVVATDGVVAVVWLELACGMVSETAFVSLPTKSVS